MAPLTLRALPPEIWQTLETGVLFTSPGIRVDPDALILLGLVSILWPELSFFAKLWWDGINDQFRLSQAAHDLVAHFNDNQWHMAIECQQKLKLSEMELVTILLHLLLTYKIEFGDCPNARAGICQAEFSDHCILNHLQFRVI